MAVHQTAYDTTACQGFLMAKTVDAVKRAIADGQVKWYDGTHVYLLQGGSSVADAVPPFAHPIYVARDQDDKRLMVDMRAFGRWDTHQHEFVITNTIEFKLALHRAHLNDIWITGSPNFLRDVSPLPMSVYASWISENVTKRFGLDPGEQYKLMIYAAIFYLSLFEPNKYSFRGDERSRTAMVIARTLHVSAKDVLEILDADTCATPQAGDGCPIIDTTDQFCSIVSQISVRLKEFNKGILYAVLGSTWFGANAKEMVAVAVEHPPTWIAILLAAYQERTYKNSGITKLTERKGNRNSGEDYVRAVLRLLTLHLND